MHRRTRGAAVTLAAAALLTLSACGDGDDSGADGGNEANGENGQNGENGENGQGSLEDNGVADLSAREISDRAVETLAEVDSVRLSTASDEMAEILQLDLHFDRQGNCAGEAGFLDQGSFEVLVSGEEVWMKPDRTFWEQNAPDLESGLTLEEVEGQYVHGNLSQDEDLAAMVTQLCDMEGMLADLGEPGPEIAKGERTEHEGIPVITLVEDHGDDTANVLVATEGEPYPLLFETVSADGERYTMTFSDFDAPVEVTPPSADLVLDVAELGPDGLKIDG